MKEKDEVIDSLELLIRRFFRIRVISGLVITSGLLGLAFLLLSVMNYYAVFPQWTRLVMFYTFISLALLVLGYYVLLPLFHYRDIGKKLSLEDAARIAGLHFGEKSYDYLLSYLQLYFQHTWSGSEELRKAGLIQKKFFLDKIPIPLAVQWKEILPVVRKYFPIIILLLLCWILWPHIIQTGSRRWIEYDKPARDLFPFKINPNPNSLIALSSSQHTIWVSVSGNSIPGELNIQLEGNEFQMQKKDERNFYYVIPNIHKNVNFSIRAGSYESEVFTVEVVRKPWWESWVTEIEYPAYLNRKKDIFSNQGDLTVPAGSRIKWLLKPRNSGKAGMIFQDNVLYFSDNHLHSPSFTLMKSTSYALFLQPDHPSFSQTDSARFHIQVIPDQYPEIQCTFSLPDSTNPLVLRINGHLKDDYGFSRFYLSGTLNYTDSSGKTVRQTTLIPLPLDKQNTYFPFETEFDFASLLPSPGAKLDLYLEVFDNDGVQGPKSSRSMPYIVKKPDKEEMQQLQKENQQTIQEELQESLTKSKDLQKQINDLISKLRDKKTPDYEDRKKLEDLLKKQNELKNNIEKLNELQQKNTQMQQELNPEELKILEKQQELQKLFDEMLNPELKKMLEELQKLQSEFLQKNQLMEKLEEMKMNTRELEKELDRNLELFKQLEWQQKMWENIDKLEELKKKEDALTEKMEQMNPKDKDAFRELTQQQEDIRKEWEKWKESYKETEEKNKKLEEPQAMPDLQEDMKKNDELLDKSIQEMQKQNKKSAGASQKQSSQQMQKMLDKMNQSMQSLEKEQQEENIQTLRQILDNLMFVSFEQEKLIEDIRTTRQESPKFGELIRRQRQLREDVKVIEDSLTALSKRAPQISSYVNKEINQLYYQMDKSQKSLMDRNVTDAQIRMQGGLTSVNNLALLLSEAMEQMMQQMQNSSSKSCSGGTCKKPGSGQGQSMSGNSQIPNLRKLQEQLNKRIEELKKQMEQGNKPNGNKQGEEQGKNPGQQGKQGISGMPSTNMEFAKMAAEQEMIRRQLMQLLDKLKNKGQQPGGDISDLMEQTEKDLLYKRISPETIRRQQEILTRLLESEKAEREREQDEKRESREGKNIKNGTLPSVLPYKNKLLQEKMNYFVLPPDYTPYYKSRTFYYLNGIR